MHCVCFSMYLSIEVCVHMSFCMEMGGNCMSLSHVLQLVGSVATHSVLPSSSTPTATVTVQQLPSLNPTSRTMLWWGHSPLFFLLPLSSLWVIAAHWQNASSIQFFLFLTSEPKDSSPTFPFACIVWERHAGWTDKSIGCVFPSVLFFFIKRTPAQKGFLTAYLYKRKMEHNREKIWFGPLSERKWKLFP